jgi:hypothetical protein
MKKAIVYVLATIFVGFGVFYFINVLKTLRGDPLNRSKKNQSNLNEPTHINWDEIVADVPGIPISNNSQFDQAFFNSVKVQYWPNPEIYRPPSDYESTVLFASLLLLKKYNDSSSINLEKDLLSINVSSPPHIDLIIQKNQKQTMRYVWKKVKEDDLLITFFTNNPKLGTYFDDNSTPQFYKSLNVECDIAEIQFNIVSEDGSSGLIRTYMYKDFNGNITYTGNMILKNNVLVYRDQFQN